jgi:ABC-type Mn2+/Zn2+ transport system ATPase subunit
MIQKFYVHNFKYLENFELNLEGSSSALLIGRNGTGKTTVGKALEILQKIARGSNRVKELVSPEDFTRKDVSIPIKLEITVKLGADIYIYLVSFEFPSGFNELRVIEESLTVSGTAIFTRTSARVQISKAGQQDGTVFGIDWHLVALPIIHSSTPNNPIFKFRDWLANILILRPVPSLFKGFSDKEASYPESNVSNFGEWLSGLLVSTPSAYALMSSYLSDVMPDFKVVDNLSAGGNGRSVSVSFSSSGEEVIDFRFEELSDGEKCFMIFAMVIAANQARGPLLCFWDEPDTHLAPSEIGHSIMALRQAFQKKGQLLATSHSPEVIRHFSDNNTLVLTRSDHRAPTRVKTVEEYRRAGDIEGDFISALLRGDLA